jgi:hypothetical protein
MAIESGISLSEVIPQVLYWSRGMAEEETPSLPPQDFETVEFGHT